MATTGAGEDSDEDLPLAAMVVRKRALVDGSTGPGVKLPPVARPTTKTPVPQKASSSSAASRTAHTAEKMFTSRLHKAWNKTKIDHAQLLNTYKENFETKKAGSDLLKALLDAAKGLKAQPRPSDGLPIKHFVVQLDGLSPVSVLRWDEDDGSIGDVHLAKDDSPEQIAIAEKVLLDRAKNRLAQTGGATDPATRIRLRTVLKSQSRATEFKDVLAAWKQVPGNKVRADVLILEDLLAMTMRADAKSIPINDGEGRPHQDIQRFILDMPGLARPLDVLRRLNDDGTFGDMRIVPADKTRLPWLVSQMEGGKMGSEAAKRRVAHQGERVADSLWKPLQKHLSGQFEAFRAIAQEKKQRVPAAGAFVKHLDQLCIDDDKSVSVDTKNGIVRHVVMLDGSPEPITLLRRTDDRGMAALRVVQNDLSDQDAVLRGMVKYVRKDQRGQTVPAVSGAPEASVASARPPGRSPRRASRKMVMQHAAQFKKVLELAVANKEAGSQDLLADVATQTGIPDRELRRWLDPDGALMLSQSSLLKLTGFVGLRDDLAILFNALGQPGSVAKLPEHLTTAKMVEVLEACHRHPGKSVADIGRIVDVHPRLLEWNFSIGPSSVFMLSGNSKLRNLPDYAEHHPALVAALTALGQVERANDLLAPETGAQRFLRELKEKLYYVRLGVTEMQNNPDLSQSQAANLVNAWPELPDLLNRVVGPDGTLRAAADIARNFPEFEDDQRPALQRLLDRLSLPAGADGMIDRLLPAKGLEPGKVFVVRDPSGAGAVDMHPLAPSSIRSRRLNAIYANSPDLIVAPRSYCEERPKQALRWLSTLLKAQFKDATEVQAYWDDEHGKVWVSSNSTSANKKIENFLKEGNLLTTLQARAEGTPHTTREGRHLSKLHRMLSGESAHPPEAAALLEAMRNSENFEVPQTDWGGVQTHAERRIKRGVEEQYGEGSFDSGLVAGTRRPCGMCAKDLSLPETAHRGPFWMSRAGVEGYDLEAAIEHDRAASIGTFITRTRDGELDLGYDTDSMDDESVTPKESGRGKRKASVSAKRTAPKESKRGDSSVLGKRTASDVPADAAADGRPRRNATGTKRRLE